MMNLGTQRRMAAQILKCGESRVWMSPEAAEKIKQAITRRDVRGLIKDGLVRKIPRKKSDRTGPRLRMLQAAKGRGGGAGSRKGATGGRAGKKERWLKIIRPQRSLLKSLRSEKKMLKDYGSVYRQAKGGAFRSRHHLLSHLEERKLASVSVSEYEAAEKARKTEMKKRTKEALRKRYGKIFAENGAKPSEKKQGRKEIGNAQS